MYCYQDIATILLTKSNGKYETKKAILFKFQSKLRLTKKQISK